MQPGEGPNDGSADAWIGSLCQRLGDPQTSEFERCFAVFGASESVRLGNDALKGAVVEKGAWDSL